MTRASGVSHPDGIAMPEPVLTRTRFGPVQHVDAGQGEALLSLHGGLGGFDQSWLLACALLTDLTPWRMLALSRPGYLETPLSVGRAPEAQADAYAALLDELKIDRAVVAGLSAGGPSAVQFALRHPDRCRALILVSAVSGRLDVPPQVLRRLRMVTTLLKIPGMQGWLQRKVMRDPTETARWSISDPALIAKTLADTKAGPLFLSFQESVAMRLRARLPGMINDVALFRDLPELPLDRVSVPTLLIHGTADPVVPFTHARLVAERLPGVCLHAITGGEHAALFTHLDECRSVACRFLAGIDCQNSSVP